VASVRAVLCLVVSFVHRCLRFSQNDRAVRVVDQLLLADHDHSGFGTQLAGSKPPSVPTTRKASAESKSSNEWRGGGMETPPFGFSPASGTHLPSSLDPLGFGAMGFASTSGGFGAGMSGARSLGDPGKNSPAVMVPGRVGLCCPGTLTLSFGANVNVSVLRFRFSYLRGVFTQFSGLDVPGSPWHAGCHHKT
jgi:hypothetical protein